MKSTEVDTLSPNQLGLLQGEGTALRSMLEKDPVTPTSRMPEFHERVTNLDTTETIRWANTGKPRVLRRLGSQPYRRLSAYRIPELGCHVSDLAFDLESQETPSERSLLDARLQAYTELPYGWDGDESRPACIDALTDVFYFLDRLTEAVPDIMLPRPQVAPDGELGVFWDQNGIFADIGFYGDGTYSYYAEVPAQGSEAGGDEIGLKEPLPKDLLSILTKLDAATT